MAIRKEDALRYHSMERHGKLEVVSTKPCVTQRDLSLSYTLKDFIRFSCCKFCIKERQAQEIFLLIRREGHCGQGNDYRSRERGDCCRVLSC